MYDYGDGMISINMDDIIYCVKNDVTEDEFMEWSDYCTWASEFKQPTPNLKSWMRGCPRCSKEEMEHLSEMRERFDEEIRILQERNQCESF